MHEESDLYAKLSGRADALLPDLHLQSSHFAATFLHLKALLDIQSYL